MAESRGLILKLNEPVREKLVMGFIGRSEQFSDALSVVDYELKGLNLVLICGTKGNVLALSLATVGARVATGKQKVEFFDFVSLSGVTISRIRTNLERPLLNHFDKACDGLGGKCPQSTWLDVIRVIKELSRNSADEIDRLLTIKRHSGFSLRGKSVSLLLQEREALGVALDIFSGSNELRKEVLRSWGPGDGFNINADEEQNILDIEPDKNDLYIPSFIQGLSSKYMLEDEALNHDMANFTGMESEFQSRNVSQFECNGRRLNVIYANRNHIEKTLGVDLVYFNEEFNSYVLVQYKIMREKHPDNGYFYRPDEQFYKELERMDDFLYEAAAPFIQEDFRELECHKDFRLNSNPFLFKLVPNNGFNIGDTGLIKGLYLPHDYVHFLVGANGPKGKNGGTVLGFKSSPRYLSNTEFSTFVQKGYIGSKGVASKSLRECIASSISLNRAVLIAIDRNGWYSPHEDNNSKHSLYEQKQSEQAEIA